MAINIKNLETRIQKKAASVTSNTPTAELGDIIEAANLATGGLAQYDSAGLLPTASSTQNIKIAYIKKDNSIRFNSGSAWNTMTPNAAVGGATTPSAGPDTVRLGETAGYVMSGASSPGVQTSTQKFLFAAGTSAAGSVISGLTSLFSGRYIGASAQSPTHAYHSGGYGPPPAPAAKNVIEKFPFASEDTYTDVGDLLSVIAYLGGTSSPTHGYVHGGFSPASNVIQKYSTSSDGNATDVGDTTATAYGAGGAQSENHGYVIGGFQLTGTNRIQKYSFASDGNATAVGNTTQGPNLYYLSNNGQSTTHGYQVGGTTGTTINDIAKFAFASDGDATDVGDLTQTKQDHEAHSATDGYIYVSGGEPPSGGLSTIERFAYGSDGNAVDCGDLSPTIRAHGGAHV